MSILIRPPLPKHGSDMAPLVSIPLATDGLVDIYLLVSIPLAADGSLGIHVRVDRVIV